MSEQTNPRITPTPFIYNGLTLHLEGK